MNTYSINLINLRARQRVHHALAARSSMKNSD